MLSGHEWDSGMSEDDRLLIELVSTPSVSGSERACVERFVAHAAGRGFETEIDEAGNAVAHRGPRDASTHIVLLGHIDTVTGHISVRVERGVLHGRGSVDAKGPLCAMLGAAARCDLPEGARVSVIGAVGEETAGSPGARFLADSLRPDACIIGEPSGWDGVTLGYKGRLLATANTEVPHHHSAGGVASASDELYAWWAGVRDKIGRLNSGRTGIFQEIQATVHAMSSECDGLTQRARIEAGFRLPPWMTTDELAEVIGSCAGERVSIACTGMEQAHATDRNDPVVRALSSAIRSQGGRPRPKLKTGTADLNVVGPVWGCPIAAYGPGDSDLDHTPNERLDLGEYARSIDVLASAITSLAAELVPNTQKARALRNATPTTPAERSR